MGPATEPSDVGWSIRLKYGIHTVFLLIDPLAPFSEITNELLTVLRQRHPDGLTPSATDPTAPKTPVPPEGDEVVAYGELKSQHDVEQGWRDLGIKGSETLLDKRLKNNAVIAFVIRAADQADEKPEFVVEWPKFMDEEPETDAKETPDAGGDGEDDDMEL